jgi:hypothetical protein
MLEADDAAERYAPERRRLRVLGMCGVSEVPRDAPDAVKPKSGSDPNFFFVAAKTEIGV